MKKIYKSKESEQRVADGRAKAIERSKRIGLELKEKYYENPKKCKTCDKILPYEKRRNIFCNHSCSAIKSNPSRTRIKSCLNCGKPVKKGARRFCSPECSREGRYKEFISEWLQNPSFGNKEHLPNQIRRWLGEQHGEQCWECGWAKVNPTTGNIPLNAHHLDGHSKNNRPENLKLLCPNCHSLTETYGSLNNGNGRELRYKKQESA